MIIGIKRLNSTLFLYLSSSRIVIAVESPATRYFICSANNFRLYPADFVCRLQISVNVILFYRSALLRFPIFYFAESHATQTFIYSHCSSYTGWYPGRFGAVHRIVRCSYAGDSAIILSGARLLPQGAAPVALQHGCQWWVFFLLLFHSLHTSLDRMCKNFPNNL